MIPIDYKHWLSLHNWSFEQAAYLFTGIDPNDENYITLLKSHRSWTTLVNSNPEPHTHLKQFNKYLQVLQNAVFPDSDHKYSDMDRVPVSEILSFAKKKKLKLSPKFLKASVYYSNFANKSSTPPPVTKQKPTDQEGHFGQNAVDAFDPLPISGIASLFNNVTSFDLDKWRKLASKAKTNGLDIARTEASKGRGESTFNPVLVANWLISIKGISAERLERKLKSNLPERSRDYIEEIFGLLTVFTPPETT
jgi:hypothetical protein